MLKYPYVRALAENHINNSLKGLFIEFTWGVQGTVYSSGILFTLSVFFIYFYYCGRYDRFNGVTDQSKMFHTCNSITV